MRRVTFLIMGILECAVAVVLVSLGLQLPNKDEVAAGFQSADRVTQHAGNQAQILRRQVQELRRPELQQLAERLQSQALIVTDTVESEQVDFETVQTMRDALAEIGNSLDSLVRTLAAKDKEKNASPPSSDLQATLQRSADVLKTSSNHLNQVLKHRDRYEETLRQSVAIAKTLAVTLPFLTEQLDNRLAEEEHALNELESSLDEVRTALPIYARTTIHVLESGRLLAWLGASLAAVHGCYLMFSARFGRRYSM